MKITTLSLTLARVTDLGRSYNVQEIDHEPLHRYYAGFGPAAFVLIRRAATCRFLVWSVLVYILLANNSGLGDFVHRLLCMHVQIPKCLCTFARLLFFSDARDTHAIPARSRMLAISCGQPVRELHTRSLSPSLKGLCLRRSGRSEPPRSAPSMHRALMLHRRLLFTRIHVRAQSTGTDSPRRVALHAAARVFARVADGNAFHARCARRILAQ